MYSADECMGTSHIAKLVFCIWLVVNARIHVNLPTDLTESAWPFFAYRLAHGNFLITRIFSILCILPYLKQQISVKPICVIAFISTTYSKQILSLFVLKTVELFLHSNKVIPDYTLLYVILYDLH
jgi:hypothetical protein